MADPKLPAKTGEPKAPALPATLSFQITRPCVAGEMTFRPGEEQALLDARLHPGTLKFYLLTGAIAGSIPGVTIDEQDRQALFAPPVEG